MERLSATGNVHTLNGHSATRPNSRHASDRCGRLKAVTTPYMAMFGLDDADIGKFRTVQIPLAFTKIENAVRDLGVNAENALMLAEHTEI